MTELQRQSEQRCENEIEDIKREVRAGNITPSTSHIKFSDETIDEQKHSVRIADEKVALAIQAYDLVCVILAVYKFYNIQNFSSQQFLIARCCKFLA